MMETIDAALLKKIQEDTSDICILCNMPTLNRVAHVLLVLGQPPKGYIACNPCFITKQDILHAKFPDDYNNEFDDIEKYCMANSIIVGKTVRDYSGLVYCFDKNDKQIGMLNGIWSAKREQIIRKHSNEETIWDWADIVNRG